MPKKARRKRGQFYRRPVCFELKMVSMHEPIFIPKHIKPLPVMKVVTLYAEGGGV